MLDKLKREINYMRISITDRCNLRCVYCMPSTGVKPKPHEEILSYEEISRTVKAALEIGISRIRLTGGEPLVRKGVCGLIADLSRLPGIEDLSLTTNGILLKEMAVRLKEAGLSRVNISMDTLDEKKYQQITRCGDFHSMWRGVEEALRVGLGPVKLNVVVVRGTNDMEVKDFALLAKKYPLHVRFIELMPMGSDVKWAQKHFVSLREIREKLLEFEPLQKKMLKGSGPALNYTIQGGMGTIGFISPMSNHFCASCNRLRLTADGKLRPCLSSEVEFDLRKILRENGEKEEIKKTLLQAIASKPGGHSFAAAINSRDRIMSQIGG